MHGQVNSAGARQLEETQRAETQRALTTSRKEAACLGGSTNELGGELGAPGAEEAVLLLGEASVLPGFLAD